MLTKYSAPGGEPWATFRAASERLRASSFWALFPLEAAAKSSPFIRAERIKDRDLTPVLEERLS